MSNFFTASHSLFYEVALNYISDSSEVMSGSQIKVVNYFYRGFIASLLESFDRGLSFKGQTNDLG